MIINQIAASSGSGGWQVGDLLTSYANKDEKWLECNGYIFDRTGGTTELSAVLDPTVLLNRVSQCVSTTIKVGAGVIYSNTIYFIAANNIYNTYYGTPCIITSSDLGASYTITNISTDVFYTPNMPAYIEVNSSRIVVTFCSYNSSLTSNPFQYKVGKTSSLSSNSWTWQTVYSQQYGNTSIYGFATNGSNTMCLVGPTGVYCTTNFSSWTLYQYGISGQTTYTQSWGINSCIYDSSLNNFYVLWKYYQATDFYISICSATGFSATNWQSNYMLLTRSYNTINPTMCGNNNGLALVALGSNSTATPWGIWIDLSSKGTKTIGTPAYAYYGSSPSCGYYNGTWLISRGDTIYFSTASSYSAADNFTILTFSSGSANANACYIYLIQSNVVVFGNLGYVSTDSSGVFKAYWKTPTISSTYGTTYIRAVA